MSQAPSMPVFPDALIADTTHLSTEEFGAYCLLLFATWRNNGQPFPDDDKRLARICRVGGKKWERMRPTLAAFFDTSSSFWRQKRLEKEWDVVQLNIAQKSRAGSASALKRKEVHSTAVSTERPTETQRNGNTQPQPQLHKKEEDNMSSFARAAKPDLAAEMTAIWNDEVGGRGHIRRANKPTPARRASCLRRLRDNFGSDLEGWRQYCRCVAASPFLRGENDRLWSPDLDWVLKPENMAHIMEGRYAARLENGGGNGRVGPAGPDAPPPTIEELFGDDHPGTVGFPH